MCERAHGCDSAATFVALTRTSLLLRALYTSRSVSCTQLASFILRERGETNKRSLMERHLLGSVRAGERSDHLLCPDIVNRHTAVEVDVRKVDRDISWLGGWRT